MKRNFLVFILLGAILCVKANPTDNSPAVKPERVIAALKDFETKYGKASEKMASIYHDGTDGSLISSVTTIPFECMDFNKSIMPQLKEAFIADKDIAIQCSIYEPGQGGTFQAYTGNTTKEYIMTRPSNKYGIYFISTKNEENPLHRDLIAINFEPSGIRYTGTIYYITSLRPDLVENKDYTSSNLFDNYKIQQELEKARREIEKAKGDINKTKQDIAGYSPKMLHKNSVMIYNKLASYKQSLDIINTEIVRLEDRYNRASINPTGRRLINKQLKKLHKQATDIVKKMQKIIDKM
ncbi:MAG: hypothetical protein J1F13_04870 [Prevotellaceae bacterium]|nr:hypothetical protein [Prevotellaceae bacterium]